MAAVLCRARRPFQVRDSSIAAGSRGSPYAGRVLPHPGDADSKESLRSLAARGKRREFGLRGFVLRIFKESTMIDPEHLGAAPDDPEKAFDAALTRTHAWT